MGLLSKEDLNKWLDEQIEKRNWLQISETAVPTGRQLIYLTHAGQFVVVQYDLNGNVAHIGQPLVMPMPQGRPPLDFRGGTFIPKG